MDVSIPLDVAKENRKTYASNVEIVTQGSGRLMLFAGDQKVEHLNADFYGEGITPEDNDPEHLFRIASKARIGVFATQLGLITKYGMDYKHVPYLVKLNSKTNLVKTSQAEPISNQWLEVSDVVALRKNSGLNITGVGYTVYVGSEHESEMLKEAAQIVYQAHTNGLLAVLWMYPRGKAVPEEKDPHIIAGAAGVASALGADFVKVNYPKADNPARSLKEAVIAAGRTKLICAGGTKEDVPTFLQTLHEQLTVSGASGNATGRNIHQRPLDEAVRFCNAISALTFDGKSVEQALKTFHE